MSEISKVSVFGSSGFIGSEFCNLMGERAFREARDSIKPSYKTVAYFISTTDNYNVLDNAEKDIETNLLHLVKVLNGAKESGCNKFIYISSWFVYGETKLPATEDSCLKPKGFYSITKAAAEQLVESFCRTFNINFQILRLSNIYGASDKGVSKKKNALQFLIQKLKNNEEISLYHNGYFYRDYLHVSDVVNGIKICIEKGGVNQIYNIGSGQKILFKDLIDTVYDELKSKSIINSVEPPEFHKIIQVKDFYMDISKIKSIGFEPSLPVKKGIIHLCREIND